MKMTRFQNNRGFTLLELIISLVVIALLAAIATVSVRLAVSSQEVGERKTELYQRLRFIGEQVTEKVRSAYPLFLVGGENELFSKINPDQLKGKRILAFDGSPHHLKFITTSARLFDTGENTPAFHEVHFFLGTNPKTRERGIILMERPLSFQTALKDTPEAKEDALYVTLSTEAATLDFRYLTLQPETVDEAGTSNKTVKYNQKWVDTLNTEPLEFKGRAGTELFALKGGTEGRISLPRAVEVTIALYEKQPESRDSESFKKKKVEREAIELPPMIIPLYTGLVFEKAAPDVDGTELESS